MTNLDYTNPIEVRGRDLAATIAAARAAGYISHKMVATTEAVFRLYFKTNATTGLPEASLTPGGLGSYPVSSGLG